MATISHTYTFPEWTIKYTPNDTLQIYQSPATPDSININLPLQPSGPSIQYMEDIDSDEVELYEIIGLKTNYAGYRIAINKQGSRYNVGLVSSSRTSTSESYKHYQLLILKFVDDNAAVIDKLIEICRAIGSGDPLPLKTRILKNATDIGNVEIPSDQKENAISYDKFVVGERVILIKEGDHTFYFKAQGLDTYYSTLPKGSPLKNPMTNTKIAVKESYYPTTPGITVQVGTVSRIQEGGKSRRKTRKVRKSRQRKN